MVIIPGTVSGYIFDVSIVHAHAFYTSNRAREWQLIILLYMKNIMAITIEGQRDSVKGKGKLHAIGVEYNKYKSIPRSSLHIQ
jgi:hypothetical protein